MSEESKHTKLSWAWQDMGGWKLVGQHGMRPIILSAHEHQLMLRDADRDLIIDFDPNHPDAKFILESCNNYEQTKAQRDKLLAFTRELARILRVEYRAPQAGCVSSEVIAAAETYIAEIEQGAEHE